MGCPEEDDYVYVSDDEDVEGETDVCETCGHSRSEHEDGRRACNCGKCRRFKGEL